MGKGAPFERARPFWRGRAILGEGVPLWERARPFGRGHVTLTSWVRKGAPLLERARLFGKGLFQSVTLKFNLLIQHTVSRWCSSGCVHEGCGGVDRWLQTGDWSFQIFFYRQPTRQASTKCPLPALKQLNFWMQISAQLSCFPNSNNDHCDLDFGLTVCDVVRRPYRGHEAVSEDSMLKRGGGVCGPPMALV
jgi:hypothetical protein